MVINLNRDNTINCPVLIATSDEYLDLLKPFFYLFNEFWSAEQPVTILGYKKPTFGLPLNFTFESLGEQRGIQFWAEDVKKYLCNLKDDYFIYTAEDLFLTRPVNFKSLKTLLKFWHTEGLDLARIGLGNTVRNEEHTHVGKTDGCDIIIQNQLSNHRISLQWSLWNKKYFMKHLHKGYSQWDFEVKNMRDCCNDGFTVLGSYNNLPLGHCNALQSVGNVASINSYQPTSSKLNFTDITSGLMIEQKYIQKLLKLNFINQNNLS
tara:strand:+ start:104 stop:895 length:792 start_codon:yes stop_codon:yes gene_type:complete